MSAPAREIPHGTESGYRYHGCRCDQCRAHRAAYARSARPTVERRKPAPIVHGTEGGYQYHRCRCDKCRAAHAAYRRDARARSKPAPAPAPCDRPHAADLIATLEARAAGLQLPASIRTAAGREARYRRAEVLDLITALRAAEVTE